MGVLFGTPGAIRTHGLQSRSLTLYPGRIVDIWRVFRDWCEFLNTVLNTGQVIFCRFYAVGGAGFLDVVIHPENHFFIRMPHPNNRLMEFDPCVPEKAGTEGVPQIMRANIDLFPGGF